MLNKAVKPSHKETCQRKRWEYSDKSYGNDKENSFAFIVI
jgi:hypothetical protein